MKGTAQGVSSLLSNLKLFLALSRTTHVLLDLAAPALSALLWLGGFPSPWIVAIGLLTAFAGYTAVYALNDLVDYRTDVERMRHGVPRETPDYLDTLFVRHPVAQGLLSFRKGLAWAVSWAVMALIGASLLGPVCAVLFVCGIVLEATYCLMLRVSHLRVFVSAVVKTLGGVAAVFAVDPTPSAFFIGLLFVWLFLWEIGGQNVPADWHDLDEDSELGYRTIPVRFGRAGASRIILVCLFMAVGIGVYLLSSVRGPFSIFCAGGSLVAGFFLLILPGWQVYRSKSTTDVDRLFGRASLYPLALLVVFLLSMISFA
jgi:4-hydroxybenzoate polyprenyltransferase